MKRFFQRKENRWLSLAILAFIVLVALLLNWPRAHAHDHEHPELSDWYEGLHSKNKIPCCDASEATHLADPDWESHDGHYRVRIDDEWIDVPDNAVVDGPNRDGRAIVWPVKGYMGTWIRCFLPGSMS